MSSTEQSINRIRNTKWSQSARKNLFNSVPTGVRCEGASATDKQLFVEEANTRGILFPWQQAYRVWWGILVVGVICTAFFSPFQVAFQQESGTFGDGVAISGFILSTVFTIDIFVNLNLAFYKGEIIVYGRKEIFERYYNGMFWVDIISVFPFELCALFFFRELKQDTKKALLVSQLRLLHLLRLHRMLAFNEALRYSSKISLITSTLIRNFSAVLATTHASACGIYFLARYNDFDGHTWLGPHANELNDVERYITALYWSITTFTTVGYGDFAPVNAAEQVWGMLSMLTNILVAACIIGSITLLIVKGDEKSSEYRNSLKVLRQYAEMHSFDFALQQKLNNQLNLEFKNREIADEQVLRTFPSVVRRKILRRLYMPCLVKTDLMVGIRQQFADAFLTACRVEIYSPGEEIVTRGSILSDLFLLVGGVAQVSLSEDAASITGTDGIFMVDDSEEEQSTEKQIDAGSFIGEIGFFTESPQVESVACITVCKTLTMPRSTYKLIAQDHPGSVGKILNNLLTKIEKIALDLQILEKAPSILRTGSLFYNSPMRGSYGAFNEHFHNAHQKQETLATIRDLVTMHMRRQKDDQTTRFLFAASRGDTSTISLMCDQGFDPNSADYDSRTALMVSSMKGNTDVVKLILEFNSNPNMVDVHGSSALYEAVKNGHDNTMHTLLLHGADLCMEENRAASVLCQAVSDGDIIFLKRLLRAGIQANAMDYDKRTASHIAAAEGNMTALKVLVDLGADITLEDRWGNTIKDEACNAKTNRILDFIKSIQEPTST